MSSKRLNLGSIDYISGLPDCLISHILSFVPTKEAASTSVLAKRWRYLFALTPNLDFDDSVYPNPGKGRRKKYTSRRKKSKNPRGFVDFVDRALVLHQHVPLKRFSLNSEGVIHPAIITGWLLKVMERGVLDLELNISSKIGYPLPPEMFCSETLVRLKLGVRDVLTMKKVKHVFLPNVRSICLDHVKVKYSVFSKLLSGCKSLEELVLNNLFEVGGSFSVSHNTLKRLVVRQSDTCDHEHHKSVSFCTPNLVYLEYSDTFADEYPEVDFSSLVEASIDLQIPSDLAQQYMDGNAADFLMGICNVKILYLSEYTVEVLTYRRKQTPEFNNLVHLTIKTDSEVSWESLPALLKNCPNLETLVLEGFDLQFDNCPWWDTSAFLSSNSVKVLKILEFLGAYWDDEFSEELIKQIKLILEGMPNLEQLTIYYETSNDEDVYELLKKLQRHPRVASSKCKIQVISDDLCLSTTVPLSVTNKWFRLL